MKYMGSKRRIAKHIIPIMVEAADKADITKWVEPFVGGANLIDKVPDRFERVGYDLNEHAIYALKDIRDGADGLPDSVTEQEYNNMKGSPAASVTSWARFECSFGAKFEGGYARNKTGANYAIYGRNLALKQSPLIQGVKFIHANYRDLSFTDSLIYCDPPYQNTSGYKTGKFNHDEFFDWCRLQAKSNVVFVSEYNAPEDFELVWQGEIKTNFASDRKKATHNRVEKLFRVVVQSQRG
ncbi:DNA methylase [Proteus phage PM 75]|uniref:site-specific DNA-methyltransferase (adenine-specific) n=1 Tax=Proteus phage PM 75 TaxID=1560282 RepID=A0A0F6NY76_9CAUD|nr:DNA methylase [Proteus phage PM 75]AIW03086.1 DNA methylase [Proteus phage PM 75]